MRKCVFRAGGLCLLVCSLASAAWAAQAPKPPATPPTIPGYIIGADDLLTVTFWRDQISADVVVRPDGRISLPLLNDIQAAGYTPEGLARALEEAASKYITEPSAVVMVKEVRSRKVFVLGEVGNPGMVPLVSNMNLMQLLAMSGGLLEHADKKNIMVIRTENGQETRIKFNYNEVVDGKNVKQNIQLQPGDVVVVR